MSIMWGRWAIISVAIVSGGWALMRMTTPTEEQFYEKLSPELKKQMDEVRRRRQGNSEMMQRLEQAAKNGEVVWGDTLDNPPTIKRK